VNVHAGLQVGDRIETFNGGSPRGWVTPAVMGNVSVETMQSFTSI
jgi:hypothetical protein